MNFVQCNREARSLLQAAAGDKCSDDPALKIPKDLAVCLKSPDCCCRQGNHLIFGSIPVLVHAALLESRNCEKFLLAVLTRESTDD